MGVTLGCGRTGFGKCANPNVCPAGIRYFRHAEIQQELRSAGDGVYFLRLMHV
jgi:hypothetical protein